MLERHELGLEGRMVCTVSDLRESRTMRQQMQQHRRQEVEANEFAIGLLVPDHAASVVLKADPDIDAVKQMQGRLDISLEAARQQLPRIAAARRLPPERLEALLERQSHRPLLGLARPPLVNVLAFNLALDQLAP